MTPTSPPSTPAARWVTKLLISGRLARAGGASLCSLASVSSEGSRSFSPSPFVSARAASSLAGSSEISVAVPSMVCAGRLPLPLKSWSWSPKGSAITLTFNLQQIALRGCRLGVHERKDIFLARFGRDPHPKPKRSQDLCYRLGQAITNETPPLRYRAVLVDERGESSCRARR